MRKTRHNKKIRFMALSLLAVFVNLYLVQLVCNLPHLAQRLHPVASIQEHQHNKGHDEHSHTHAHEASAPTHQHSDKHPASPTEDSNCCTEQGNTPFLKASTTVELPSLIKAPLALVPRLVQAALALLYQNRTAAVSHAPPDNSPPKIPDIRIFLHSLII
ncbi:hypothetical protein I2I11_02755 [Pontibacter sp. 172403-2]|uniref:hypothetical protein n=1 Tax=Pontibacter rufus TaxID=2791028 RepID=UPI0018B00455|nr:hypothetical protein [Pontibacter sp. 172403-2]MBF9252204.1 hypothetical protein [Pontibacter sp. 172403-2]